jgi:hypothetical protein
MNINFSLKCFKFSRLSFIKFYFIGFNFILKKYKLNFIKNMHLKRYRRKFFKILSLISLIIILNWFFTYKNCPINVKEIEIEMYETDFALIGIKKILEIFNKNNVFLLDIGILKHLKLAQSTLLSGHKYPVKNFLESDKLFNNTQYINFGIRIQSFNNFNQVSVFLCVFVFINIRFLNYNHRKEAPED